MQPLSHSSQPIPASPQIVALPNHKDEPGLSGSNARFGIRVSTHPITGRRWSSSEPRERVETRA
jgi:hypothetical protein